ncbi:MAG: hypothetical protein IJJ41_05330 [Clostridia bacterium]|nr:hypothetical protein [Clostridia bacterium]
MKKHSMLNKYYVIYLVGILAAGACHVFGKSGEPFLDTVLFCLNFTIYVVLILLWMISLTRRLLPSKPRSYMLFTGALMLLFLVLRSIVYRVVTYDNPVLERYIWYSYYIPMSLGAVSFFLVGLSFGKRGQVKSVTEVLMFIPALLFSIAFLTNDYHRLAFVSSTAYWVDIIREYRRGVFYYLFAVYAAVLVLAGLFLLIRAMRKQNARGAAAPALFVFAVFIGVALGMMGISALLGKGIRSPFNEPEMVIFSVIAVYECCIQTGLIPHNRNYPGFFGSMHYPAVITDTALTPVYHTRQAVDAQKQFLESAKAAPVQLDEDRTLIGKSIKGGYAFWVEDESELHRMNDRLRDANETLALENELIEKENELLREIAGVKMRNSIYAEIAEKMYPAQKRIEELLESTAPEAAGFRDTFAKISVINAYIKRASNLMLMQDTNGWIDLSELEAAIKESAVYLQYLGVEAKVESFEEGLIQKSTALSMYESFEIILEELTAKCTAVQVRYFSGCLRLKADCTENLTFSESALPVESVSENGTLHITVKGGVL